MDKGNRESYRDIYIYSIKRYVKEELENE